MALTTKDDYPTSIEEIDDMVCQNRRLKALVQNLLRSNGCDDAPSSALVRSSEWDRAPSVDAVQAMRGRAGTKAPKGWGKRAAAQASGGDSDGGDAPLAMRDGVKGPIAKKKGKNKRKPPSDGPKKLTPYTYFVRQMHSACAAELAAATSDDDDGDDDDDDGRKQPNKVMALAAQKWNGEKENADKYGRWKEECATFLYFEKKMAAELAARDADAAKNLKKVRELATSEWNKVLKDEEEYKKVKMAKERADAAPTDAPAASMADDGDF